MSNRSRFLLEGILGRPGDYTLDRQESHHAVNVLRHRVGDAVVVFDGRGNYAEAAVIAADRDAVRVCVDEVRREQRRPPTLTIATAIPKGKRWQLLVEKCTELGVDRILPMLTERSVAKGEGDADKWRRWIVEAAKQARRSWLPEIAPPMDLGAVLDLARREEAFLLLADAGGENPRAYRGLLERTGQAVALIGPEGGFSPEEVAECQARGAKMICLSPFNLRVETAAASICAIIREVLM